MNTMIFNPLEEFSKKYKSLHADNTNRFLEKLVAESGVNVEENRKTVQEYNDLKQALVKMKKKLGWMLFLRVLMCITIVLIPLVILKTTPNIKNRRNEIADVEKKAEELYELAHRQMAPLNRLFTDRDCLSIIESTIPLLSFAPCFSVEQENNMITNYDFNDHNDGEQSTTDVLAGHYNENPFVFERKLIHTMGVETYHGTKTIHWTETYRGSDGKVHTRTRTQTLRASVTKPKPFYSTKVLLNYCAQGGPELSFTRDATHLHKKDEKELERYVKRGERKLKKMTDKAIKKNSDFVSMSNTDFEVLFDALDRTDEVQFRTLFTPLAQTNMVDLICSQVGYGDDFHFIKQKRTNRIATVHSQGRAISLLASEYYSYSFDIIKESFINKNVDYFKAVYFDFAPLWAIPVYQERPVHSLDPLPDYSQKYSYKECEALSNMAEASYMVHPLTKTQAILKSTFIGRKNEADEICVTAHSYDKIPRIDYVSVMGGDGRLHSVPVPWDEYIPLEAQNHFLVANEEQAGEHSVIARRNHLCIFQ